MLLGLLWSPLPLQAPFWVLLSWPSSTQHRKVLCRKQSHSHNCAGSMLAFSVLGALSAIGLAQYVYNEKSAIIYPVTAWCLVAYSAHLPIINDMPMRVLPPAYHDFGSSRLSFIQARVALGYSQTPPEWAQGLSGAAGPAIGGAVIERWSLQTMFGMQAVVAGVISVVGLIGYMVYPSRTERKSRCVSGSYPAAL